jgi:hypothetical protein|tara:strand:- start:4287 stop:4388 length:102 start_codon:yes stop_codon:yes gene_type:complete
LFVKIKNIKILIKSRAIIFFAGNGLGYTVAGEE